jgi:hypothetical protein
MCHLSGGTIRFFQHRSTIRIFGGAVQTSLPVAVSHIHLVLSDLVPISKLSTKWVAVELAIPMTTSFLHLAVPFLPSL